MPAPPCPRCAGSAEPGWLCAAHGLPWQHDGCSAEGAPCSCNPGAAVGWRQVHAADLDHFVHVHEMVLHPLPGRLH